MGEWMSFGFHLPKVRPAFVDPSLSGHYKSNGSKLRRSVYSDRIAKLKKVAKRRKAKGYN